jgi:multimeric flavodoxin WrbA
MEAVAFNGSPRKGGNTEILLKKVFMELESEGIKTEIVQIGGKLLHGCSACMTCRQKQNGRCAIDSDDMNKYIAKAVNADIILLGSPTYFSDVSSEMKALIDRLGFVSRSGGSLLKNKIGASVVAVRRGGATHAFDTMNHFFQVSSMIIVGSTYWNFAIGREKGEVLNDNEGMDNMADLGKRIAWLSKKLCL